MTTYTMAQIRAANAAAGFRFFGRAEMRFCNSRIETAPYHLPNGRVLFVTSETRDFWTDPTRRTYAVREFHPQTGQVNNAPEIPENPYQTRADAIESIRQLRRTTEDVYIVQGNYLGTWEDVTAEKTRMEARQRRDEYNSEEPGFQHRIIKRTQKKEATK